MRTKTNDVTKRKKALAKFLGISLTTLGKDIEIQHKGIYTLKECEYMVLTDDEANEKAKEYILDSLWAFNASFIVENSDLPQESEEMIKTFQEKKYEGANETIRALIKDIDGFVEAAISADGRGHFLSGYDGEEHKQDGFYIYRVN